MRGKTFDQCAIVEASERGNDRDPVQEREVAAENDHDLESDDHYSRDVARDARPKDKPRRHQFRDVIEKCPATQHASRQKMKPAAEPVRNRLRFEVIIKRGQIAPARVAADFYQARSRT